MVLTPHLLVGAAVAVRTGNPVLGLTLAFFSHLIVDLIPHSEYWDLAKNVSGKWNYSTKKILVVVFDALFGFLLLWFLANNRTLAFAGGLLGILMDLDMIYFLPFFPKLRILKLDHYSHKAFTHWFENKKPPLFLGVTTQVLTSLVAIYFLL